MICQKLLAGFANPKRSTITLFHKSFPTKARITKANTKESSIATEFAYTSRLALGALSENPSTAARTTELMADIFLTGQFNFSHMPTSPS